MPQVRASGCDPIKSWVTVPEQTRTSLEKLVGPIAAEGEPINAWDSIFPTQLNNGFVSGCRYDDSVVLAIWIGGRRTAGLHAFVFVSQKFVRRCPVPINAKGGYDLSHLTCNYGANKSLHPTVKPLRGSPASELMRYTDNTHA